MRIAIVNDVVMAVEAMRRVVTGARGHQLAWIARDGADSVRIEVHRTLTPVLRELKQGGYRLVGLEQTTGSTSLHSYRFERKTALVIGNERLGKVGDSAYGWCFIEPDDNETPSPRPSVAIESNPQAAVGGNQDIEVACQGKDGVRAFSLCGQRIAPH